MLVKLALLTNICKLLIRLLKLMSKKQCIKVKSIIISNLYD